MQKYLKYLIFFLLLATMAATYQNCSSSKDSEETTDSAATEQAEIQNKSGIFFSIPNQLDGLCTGTPVAPSSDPPSVSMKFRIKETDQLIEIGLGGNSTFEQNQTVNLDPGQYTLVSFVLMTCFPSSVIFLNTEENEAITINENEVFNYIPEGLENLY